MKKNLISLSIYGMFAIGIITSITSCESTATPEENTQEQTPEKEPLKSKKGNWIEEDAKRFVNDVRPEVEKLGAFFGEENVDAIVECYLDKCIMEFENYDEANSDVDRCTELATECMNEFVDIENLGNEIPEEEISPDKVQEVTDQLEDVLPK